MKAKLEKLTLGQWDSRYERLHQQGLQEAAYGGPLCRHVLDGDTRLKHLQFDPSPAALRLWNLLLTEEQRRFGRHTTLVLVTPSTEDRWLTAIQSLAQRGVRVAVVLLDPSTFGSKNSPLMLFGELTASNIMTYVVGRGDDLSLALSATTGVSAWQD